MNTLCILQSIFTIGGGKVNRKVEVGAMREKPQELKG